jgi:hypothetical protein
MKIYAQKNGTYTKQELLDLAALLLKGGYTVRRGKQRVDGKPVEFVEFHGDQCHVIEQEQQEDRTENE